MADANVMMRSTAEASEWDVQPMLDFLEFDPRFNIPSEGARKELNAPRRPYAAPTRRASWRAPGRDPVREQPAPVAPSAESTARAAAAPAATTAREKDRSAADPKTGRQRKLVRAVVNLQEQERLARQAIGRSPLRRTEIGRAHV